IPWASLPLFAAYCCAGTIERSLAILSRKARSTKRPPPIAATTAAACRLTRRPRRSAKLSERAAGFGFAAQAHLRTDRIGTHWQTDRSGHAGQDVFLLN